MTIDAAQQQALADALWSAELQRAPIAPLSGGFAIDVADAYAIQHLNQERRLGQGEVLAGHKVGLTSKPMQELLGVSEPDYGFLLQSMLFTDGARLPRVAFCQPRVEPEIAFRLRTALRGPGVSAADVLAASEAVAPALEVVDSRIADWKITLVDTIADNASSAAVVLGEWVALEAAPAPATVAAELIVDGAVVDSGTGAAVLGDPANAIAWLANALAAFDVTLQPGQVLMPGSFTSAYFVHAGTTAGARFAGLGDVSVSFV